MVSNSEMMLRTPTLYGVHGSQWELKVFIGLGVSTSTHCAFDSCPTDRHVVGWGGSCTPLQHIRSKLHVK